MNGTSGLVFVDNYDKTNGVTVMTVGSGTPHVISNDPMYEIATANNGKTVNVKMKSEAYGKGSISAIFGRLVLDEASKKGWVFLDNMTGTDPFQITLDVAGLTEDNREGFLANLNSDLMVGQEQIWKALEGSESDQVIITGLSAMELPTNIFAWDFSLEKYGDLALSGIQSTAVPEPAAWALLLLGAFFVGLSRRRRK